MLTVLAWLLLQPARAFETCTGANRYLERALAKPTTEVKTSLPRACVLAAQKGLPDKGMYGYCAGEKGKIKRDKARPCLSEAYVSAVHTAIADVAECLDFDAGLAFATFNIESGAHINAVGPAGDAGVGQLTKPAIEEVNRREFDLARTAAAGSNSPACRKILPMMTKATGDVAHRCAFITVPQNPVRNVAYSMLLIRHNQRAIDTFWSRLKAKVPTGIDLARLKERLTMLAYNAGPAGTVAVAAAFVRQVGEKLTERHLNFENTAAHALRTYMANHFPVKGARKKRVAGYVPAVIAAARRTEDRAGVACFDPDLFPKFAPAFAPDDAEVPDFAEGERLVNEAIAALAEDFRPATPAFTCADAQAEFLTTFLPPGAGEDELPDALRASFDKLCGKGS